MASEDIWLEGLQQELEECQNDEVVANILSKGTKLREYTKGVENNLRQVELDSIQDYIKESDNLVSLHDQIRDCDIILSQMETLLSGFQSEIGSISSDIKVLQEKSMDMGLKLKNRKVAESKLAKFVEDIIVPPRMIDIIVDGEEAIYGTGNVRYGETFKMTHGRVLPDGSYRWNSDQCADAFADYEQHLDHASQSAPDPARIDDRLPLAEALGSRNGRPRGDLVIGIGTQGRQILGIPSHVRPGPLSLQTTGRDPSQIDALQVVLQCQERVEQMTENQRRLEEQNRLMQEQNRLMQERMEQQTLMMQHLLQQHVHPPPPSDRH